MLIIRHNMLLEHRGIKHVIQEKKMYVDKHGWIRSYSTNPPFWTAGHGTEKNSYLEILKSTVTSKYFEKSTFIGGFYTNWVSVFMTFGLRPGAVNI